MTDDLKYKIAISLIPGIGSITAKSLIAYAGSAEQVFKEKEKALRLIPGVGTVLAKNIIHASVFKRAEQEVEFVTKMASKRYFTSSLNIHNDYSIVSMHRSSFT